MIVDFILDSDNFQFTNCLADINNDNIVNIFDLVSVVETILEN